jgi:photosystem II stability/assembly factor-like uncharacterized protein
LTQSAILDIALMADGSGWAVGEAGTILHYDGRAWQSVSSPTDKTLHSVAFASENDGWAVGEAGTILHYDGRAWRSITAPTTSADELVDVALLNDQGWAVGKRFNTISEIFEGLILHLKAGAWSQVSIPQTRPLHGVALASPDDGMIVGEAGTVMRWDGITWTTANRFTQADLYAVTLSADNVWAAGERGAFVHWIQGQPQVILTPFQVTLKRIGFSDSGIGWAVGAEGTILRYDGNAWSRIGVPISLDFSGLFIDGEDIPWVTGAGGVIGRVTADGWQLDTQPYVDVDLTAIDMPGAPAADWAVGSWPLQPTDGVIFWQHTTQLWHPHLTSDAPPLFDVDGLPNDEAWAVGQDFRVDDPTEAGVVWRYKDGTWTTAGYPGVAALFAVDAVAPDDVWAAGQEGSLVHFDGNAWQKASGVQDNVHLYGLHLRTSNDGWAVGEQLELEGSPRYTAVALHYNGATWQATTVPGEAWEESIDSTRRARLLAVHVLAENDVWAVGNRGAILHYDGMQWRVMQGQRDYNLLDIDFARPTIAWAVGTQGTILRFHHGAWTSVSSPTTETLNGVTTRGWGEAWAVGSQGAFLYHPGFGSQYIFLPLTRR